MSVKSGNKTIERRRRMTGMFISEELCETIAC